MPVSSYIVTYAGTTCYHHFRWDFWFFFYSSGGAAGRRGRWGSVRRVAPSFFLSSLDGVLCEWRQGALGLRSEDRQVALQVFLAEERASSVLFLFPVAVFSLCVL